MKMRKGSNLKPLMAIIGVNFAWGLDFIAIEYLMDQVPPQILTLTRLMIGAAVLMTACLIVKKGIFISRKDWIKVFIAGAIGMSLYFSVESLGTGLTSASFSALIMATVPIFGMIGDRIFFGNKITALKIICVVASIVGVYLLVAGEPMGINITGLIAMLIAALFWAFYIVYVKPLQEKYDLLTLLTGLFISGALVSVPVALFTTEAGTINFTGTGIIITIITAIGCIIAGQFGYVYAIGKLSVTTVSIFENVLPLTTVLFSFILFHTMLSTQQIIGGIVIMAAVTVLALKGGDDSGKSDIRAEVSEDL